MAYPILLTDEATAAFWANVDRLGENECWLWTGLINHNGYGTFKITGQPLYRAHRYSLTLARGEAIPDGMLACHRCHVRRCVNPAHLYAGTASQNTRDAVAAGSHNMRRKTHCPSGHEFTADNLYLDKAGHRACRACKAASQRNPEARARRNAGDRRRYAAALATSQATS